MTTSKPTIPCTACKADLGATALDAACPQCGTPVGQSINLTVIDSAARTVAADVPCINCGYNLRTIPIHAPCPECAHPVADSIRPDELRFADTRWLDCVRSGTGMLLATACGGIVLACLVAALTLDMLDSGIVTTAGLALVLGILIWILAVGGVFDLTTSDWRQSVSLRWEVIATASRCLILALPVAMLLAALGLAAAWEWVLWAVPAVCVVGCILCTLLVLRRLAQRVRHTGLTRLTTLTIWMILACIAMGVTAERLRNAWAQQPVRAARSPGTTLLDPMLLLLLAQGAVFLTFALAISCWAMGIIVLVQFRRLFTSALRAAAPSTDTLAEPPRGAKLPLDDRHDGR